MKRLQANQLFMKQFNTTFKLWCLVCLVTGSLISSYAQTVDSTSTVVLQNDLTKLEAELQDEVHLGFQTKQKKDIVGSSSTVSPKDFLKFDTTQWFKMHFSAV